MIATDRLSTLQDPAVPGAIYYAGEYTGDPEIYLHKTPYSQLLQDNHEILRQHLGELLHEVEEDANRTVSLRSAHGVRAEGMLRDSAYASVAGDEAADETPRHPFWFFEDEPTILVGLNEK